MTITVSKLFIYPLKSGKGILQQFAEVTWRGLKNDRLWMVVDENGVMLSQRDKGCEKMALISAAIVENGDLTLSASGMHTLHVWNPNNFNNRERVGVKIHGQGSVGYDGGDLAAEWMSDYLQRKCRIMRIPDDYVRKCDPLYASDSDEVGYADAYPMLVTMEESLAALDLPAGMERFRPNVVLRGGKPFEEDAISVLQIRSTMHNFLKPSKRCPMPAVNQRTGAYEKETNPLLKLNKQRHGDGAGLKGVFFGQNVAPSIRGEIHIGDEATVIARKDPHPAVRNLPACYAA